MEALIRLALVGTARGATRPAFDDCLSGDLVRDLAVTEVEEEILLLAGTESIALSAGYAGQSELPELAPAPADGLPSGNADVQRLLSAVFEGSDKVLLVDFLQGLAAARKVLPHALLPVALNANDTEVREAVLPVAGERGRWLAGLNPDWAWVTEGIASLSATSLDALKQEFEEGSIDRRTRALASVRASDPALARDWLEATFAAEKPEHRLRLLQVIQSGISAADEPFLEKCLKDRSASIKQLAAELLGKIPGSALSKRMQQRAEGMLQSSTSGIFVKKLKLICSPPEEVDKSWEIDGIPAKPPAGIGKRAFWTTKVLAAVPLSYWTEKFACEPAALVAAIADDEFADAVLSGWTESAIRFRAGAWIEPLWKRWFEVLSGAGKKNPQKNESSQVLLQLLPQYPLESREAVVSSLIDNDNIHEQLDVALVLKQLPTPWTPRFARSFLKSTREILKTSINQRAIMRGMLLGDVARAVPYEVMPEALAEWTLFESDQAHWYVQRIRSEVDLFLTIVTARKLFVEALKA